MRSSEGQSYGGILQTVSDAHLIDIVPAYATVDRSRQLCSSQINRLDHADLPIR